MSTVGTVPDAPAVARGQGDREQAVATGGAPASPERQPLNRREDREVGSAPSLLLAWVVLVVAVVVQLAQIGWIVTDLGGDHRILIANLIDLPIPLLATLCALRAATLRGLDSRTRLAWMFVGVAFGLYFAGTFMWMVYENFLEAPPWSSAVDLIYMGNYPTLLAGLLLFPVLAHRRMVDRRFWLDAATVMVVGGAAVWYILLEPIESEANTSLLDNLLVVGYTAGDLVLLFGVCVVLLRLPVPSVRVPLALLAVGNVMMVFADLWYGRLIVVNGAYEVATWPDAAFGLAGFFWLTAPVAFEYMQARRPQRGSVEPPLAGAVTNIIHQVNLLPYAAVALGYGMLLFVARDTWGDPLGGLLLASVALTGLVVLRQYVAVRDNAAQEARFRSLVQRSSDLITVVDREGIVRYQSPSLETLLARPLDQVVGRPLAEIADPEWADALRSAILRAARSGGPPTSLAWRLAAADGSTRDVESLLTNLLDDPSIGGVVLNTRDVTERAALQEQLTHQAYHDSLTGLPNRARLGERLRATLSGSRGEGVCVMILDLDGFKNVNDSLGHLVGDRLLIELAGRLLSATRGSDMVARLGGDEFAILMTSVFQKEHANILAERILTTLHRPFTLEGNQVVIGTSIGLASCPPAGTGEDPLAEQIDQLLRNADTAMYASKAAGKNRFTWFEPEMHAAAVERLTLEAEMREGIERGEFVVYFQPIVHFDSGVASGVEALVRWRHPERGLLAPGQFIQLAEDTGLIVPLGRYVLREACRAGAEWQRLRRGAGGKGDAQRFGVTVNVSGRQLDHSDLFEDVRAALDDFGIEPSSLVLELTESTMVDNPAQTRERLLALRELGVRFAIDDFGTGYSALSYLQHFPIDLLKIDRSFVERLTSVGSHSALVSAIIALGDSMSLHCIAEGVELEEQQHVLQGLGCDYGQGFYFARPMPEDEVTRLVMGHVMPAEPAVRCA